MKKYITLFFLILLLQGNAQVVDTGDASKNTEAKKQQALNQHQLKSGGITNGAANNSDNTLAQGTTSSINQLSGIRSQVINVERVGYTSKEEAGLTDHIVVKVSHINDLLNSISVKAGKNISLYINGREIENIFPHRGAPDKDDGTFEYLLERNEKNDKIWADVLGAPKLGHSFFKLPVKIGVGIAGEYPIPIDNTKSYIANDNRDYNFKLIRINETWFIICAIIFILYLILLFYMSKRKGMLRDECIDLSALNIPNSLSRNPYSLGRFQMAFWFSLTLLSYFFIFLVTTAYNIISVNVLALIGISGLTSLSAVVIDYSKNTDLLHQTIDLQNEKTKLEIEISNLQRITSTSPSDPNLAALNDQLNTKTVRKAEIEKLINQNKKTLTPAKSINFFDDVLTDANGISFNRLQMFVWTFVLGTIFLYSVWKNLSMPDFDETLLALQGLTAGTYLGFKLPGK